MTTRPDGAIRVRVTLPVTRLGFGAFAFDPVTQFLGVSVRDLLESLLEAEPYQRPSASGTATDVFPLALPDGEGAFVPIGPLGELGFRNDRGLLAITVPLSMTGWLRSQAGAMIVRGPEQRRSSDGGSVVADAWLRLRPGVRAAMPLGLLGELGIEAA